MRFLSLIATVGVMAGLTPAFAMAQVGPGPDGLLPAPPSDARPGECFAKVIAPGQPILPPPAQPQAVWVLTPGLAGPMWCLQFRPGPRGPITFTPERHGWIRVICDKDATPERIRHIQHRLHDWGYYDGGYDGKYDKRVAAAVGRFQHARKIDHGGYLSYRTVEALDGQVPPPPPPPPGATSRAYGPAGAAYGYHGGYAQGYSAQTYGIPGYGARGYGAAYGAPGGYGAGGYSVQGAYGPAPCATGCAPVIAPPPCPVCATPYGTGYPGAPYKHWLNWPGKRIY